MADIKLSCTREAFGLIRIMIARHVEAGVWRTQSDVVESIKRITPEEVGIQIEDDNGSR